MIGTQTLRLYKNITDVFLKCYLFKVKILCNSCLNKYTEQGKLPSNSNGKIVKTGLTFVINLSGTRKGLEHQL